MKPVLLAILGSAGSLALGLVYVLHAFGPTEAEVVLWGQVLICLGLALVPLTMIIRSSSSRVARCLASLGWGTVSLLQVLPILLWFSFHGYGISDGTPPSAFVAHWAYSLPHLAVLAASVANLYALWERPEFGARPRSQLPG